MSVEKIIQITGRGIPLPGDDIDTDRITPARFLKAITFDGIEKALFCDERENTPDHPIDNLEYRGGKIMFVGKNFGSGSSREHAPQALKRFGIDALVGVSFAEIFAGNCFAIGVPVVTVDPQSLQTLISQTQKNPKILYELNIDKKELFYGELSISIEIQENQRSAFLNGSWNMLQNLIGNLSKAREIARELPYCNDFK
jgi:3-isopropylmalate/(R)-2-methylmalate dehydratase small subunit